MMVLKKAAARGLMMVDKRAPLKARKTVTLRDSQKAASMAALTVCWKVELTAVMMVSCWAGQKVILKDERTAARRVHLMAA